MPGFRLFLTATLLFILSLTFACHPASKSEATAEPAAAEEKDAEPKEEGIHLSEEEVEASGIVATTVGEGSVDETLSVQGRVIPRSGQQASVVAAFPGRLLPVGSLFPAIGTVVRQGQTLAIVEQELSATEAASIAEKRIDLEGQAQQVAQEVAQKTKDLERTRALYEGGVVALKQLQLAETDLNIARAHQQAVIRAREAYVQLQGAASGNSRRLPVTAPIAGTIITVNVAPNQQVDNSRPLFEIVNLSVVWIEAQVFEDRLANARAARLLDITTRAAPGKVFKGRLVNLTQQVDPVSKTEGVIFEVANEGNILAIGMNVDVRLPSGVAASGLVIPPAALIEEQGHVIVFVEKEKGEYERREIKVGARGPNGVIVTDGLEAGEKVVTTGAQALMSAAEGEKEE